LKCRMHKGFRVSEIGIGTYSLSGVYGRKNIEEYKRMLNCAYELGVNFFDTADTYGSAEQILGAAVKPYRDDIYIATKVGIRGGAKPDLSGEYVRRACEKSLERLQMDYVDLYQVHFDDPNIPVEETVGALEHLMIEGKIRSYGIGHLPMNRLETYCRVGNIFSVSMELSAVTRKSREQLLPLCRRCGVGVIAFSVTGRGLLTGRFQKEKGFEDGDIRNNDPLFQREYFESGLRIAEKFGELGRNYEKISVQVAIAWVLSHPEVICALTGPSTIAHLEDNVGGSGWQISSKDLEELEIFFKREDEWLEREQKISINQILLTPLPQNSSQAFTDLIYAIETALSIGLTSEKEILPIFQELWGLRKTLDEDAAQKLPSIQLQLRKLVHLC